MNSLLLILRNRRYFGPVWVFASLNIILGTWVIYIPRIKEKLSIDDGELGIALFCYALGVLGAITFTSRVVRSVGVGKATITGIILFPLLFLIPMIAPTYSILCISLFVTGIASSFTDISMNALVSDIEVEDNVNFMSAAHGFFSLGGVLGAGIGSVFIEHVTVSVYHMILTAVFVIITNLILVKSYSKIRSAISESEERFNWGLVKPLLGLTIIGFIVMGSEGAIEQWSKLYLQDIVHITAEWMAGLGFVIFSAAMTLGRFFGDAISTRFGSLKIIIGGCVIAIVGYVGILMSTVFITFLGFGLVGIGFSVIIPELFRLAGKAKGVSSSEGISFVAGFGFVGFIAAPASMGFLADMSSLRLSFLVLAIACGVALLSAIRLASKSQK